jgi:hypothetical protein
MFSAPSAASRGRAEHVHHLLELERLEHVVVRAALHRVDRGLDRAEAGHDHRDRARRLLRDLVEQRDAAHPRHLQVADDEVEGRAARRPPSSSSDRVVDHEYPVLRGADVPAGDECSRPSMSEEVREHVADDLLVVDDESRPPTPPWR